MNARNIYQCPACHAALERADRHGMTVHHCPRCRGVWFSGDALDQVLGRCRPQAQRRTAPGWRPEQSVNPFSPSGK